MSDKPIHPIVQLKQDINAALPSLGLPSKRAQERMASVLLVAVEQDPSLIHADRQSLIAAVRKCAANGLLPDNDEATLQIYNSKIKVDGQERWIKKVQLMPMVRGIIKRVLQSGKVHAFWAELVYEGENFSIDISRGDRRPVHFPDYFGRAGKKIVGAYAVAQMANGSVMCEPMPLSEIEKVRGVAKTKNVWDKWFEEKAKVAVLRRLAKRLPLSSEDMEFIMNREEHDLEGANQSTAERPHVNLASKIKGEAEEPQPERSGGDIVDAEVIQPHEYDAEAVDPFADAYTEGVKAMQEGKVESDCPYDTNTVEHNDWLGGWMHAMKMKEASDD